MEFSPTLETSPHSTILLGSWSLQIPHPLAKPRVWDPGRLSLVLRDVKGSLTVIVLVVDLGCESQVFSGPV